MDSLDSQVLDAARRWGLAGHRFALATVARTWGSAPRPPGAWMALRDDGLVQGSVSGGCLEVDLIARMAAGEFAGTAPQVVRYGVTSEEARRFGLPSGGTVELVIEPAPAWWGFGWLWLSIVVLIVIIVLMAVYGAAVFGEIRKAAGIPYRVKGKPRLPCGTCQKR